LTGGIPAGNGHSAQRSALSGRGDATAPDTANEEAAADDYHLEREAEAAEILGIPAEVTQVGPLPVGSPTATDFRCDPRTRVEEVSFLDGWGAPLVGAPGTP
jgi:hypothetical protein